MQKLAVFWFRRDLRLEDNIGLNQAIKEGYRVLPVFIFDTYILDELDKEDARVQFIHQTISKLDARLKSYGSSLLVLNSTPKEAFLQLTTEYQIEKVFANKDYEPYAIHRDKEAGAFLKVHNIDFELFKDQVVFEENEVMKEDNSPYTIYTPYKNKWLKQFDRSQFLPQKLLTTNQFHSFTSNIPSLKSLGFASTDQEVRPFDLSHLEQYDTYRDFPAHDKTSYLSPHLRFGTISIRQVIDQLNKDNSLFLSELIWREFFMQILFHFPKVVDQNFKSKYNAIEWRNNEAEFKKWCKGETGYPMVDAGMRQLNATGYMHNRVRMVTAGFLCKHLLIDWRWGEAYFAKKLLDYDLAANNGNWQWSAGTGCDSVPYFRVFNPTEQIKKFDSKLHYIRQWIPNLDSLDYPQPMVDHKTARLRALETYKIGLDNYHI